MRYYNTKSYSVKDTFMAASHELELELTYLAAEIPFDTEITESTPMLDVYVPEDPLIHSRLRLRRNGNSFKVTKKLPVEGEDASVHTEDHIDLDETEFTTLAAASQKRIEKDRYVVPLGGRTAEVDVFKGVLKGLVLIDFEFDSPEEKLAFIPPESCLADVTTEDFIAGGNLAGRSYQDIEADLARFDYKPL